MKKLLLLTAVAFSAMANGQIRVPAASSTQTLTQDFGLGKIELIYSRPNIKGRALFKENSELAPLGKVWRTGANASTKIKISDPISFGGKSLDTGSYAIFTIPGKTEWTIILNKDSKNSATEYTEKDDIFRFTVPADKLKESVETFTMDFGDIKPESCQLNLAWGNTSVHIPITTNVRDRIRAQAEKALSADKVAPNTYFAAANFYYDLDKDLNKALANATKAIEANPQAYFIFILKAKIERDLGDKTSAKADAEKCIKLATEQKNQDYVRMGRELIAKL